MDHRGHRDMRGAQRAHYGRVDESERGQHRSRGLRDRDKHYAGGPGEADGVEKLAIGGKLRLGGREVCHGRGVERGP